MNSGLLCTSETIIKAANGVGEARPLRCKRWTCDHCREINRRRVIAIAVRAKPNRFLTLTVSSTQYPDPVDAALALKKGLRLLRLRLERHDRLTNFQFLAVFERHKSGHPHLHLLIRGSFIPWKLLRKWWEEITGSTHIDIRKIDTRGKAAFYVSKYIGKDLAPFEGCKRWWRSHGYSDEAADDWQPDRSLGRPTRYFANYYKVAMMFRALGWSVEPLKPEGIKYRAPPDTTMGHSEVVAMAEGRTSGALLKKGKF